MNDMVVKFRGCVDNGMLTCNLINYAEVLLLHDKFKKLGFDITNSKQEDVYIEIIEADDQQLLDDLERYLSLNENLEDVKAMLRRFDVALKTHNENKFLNEDFFGLDKIYTE